MREGGTDIYIYICNGVLKVRLHFKIKQQKHIFKSTLITTLLGGGGDSRSSKCT